MDKNKESADQARRNRERPRGSHYQQLARDTAQPLAELQDPGANNEIIRVNERGETESERRQRAREETQVVNERRRTNHQQLAADTAQRLVEVQVPSAGNFDSEAVDSVDSKIESEIEGHAAGDKQEVRAKGKHKPRNHYVGLAAGLSGPLAQLRVPGPSNDRGSQQEAGLQSQCQATESVAYQESLSEYDPNATCGSGSVLDRVREVEQWSIESETTESSIFPRQESLSEYNPDATCGSSCGPSNTYGEMQTEREWNSRGQREATESVSYQESLSEYNPDATCGTGYGQLTSAVVESFPGQESLSKNDSDYSRVQSEIERFASKESSWTGETPKLPAETSTDGSAAEEDGKQQKDSYYFNQDGEPCTKRPKPNPEVTAEQLSLSIHSEHSYEGTRSSGNSTFALRQGWIPEMSSTKSVQVKSMTTEDIQKQMSLNSGARSRVTECLSSEFEHMNLEERNGVEPSTGSYCSVTSQTSQNLDSFKSTTQESLKELENGSSYSSGIETQAHTRATAPMVENAEVAGAASGENLITVSSFPQGARPKTNVKAPKGKKNKTPKQNTKNAYTKLAKAVSTGLSALNKNMNDSRSGNFRGVDQRAEVKDPELFYGGNAQSAGTNNSSVNVFCSEFEQVNARQQPREDQLKGPCVGNQREHSLVSEDAAQMSDETTCAIPTHATSQNTHVSLQQTHPSSLRSRISAEARVAAEYCRQQIEEQQKLIDNMGPELQALVIEMRRRDEEELGGGHVLHGAHLEPRIPPREQTGSHGQTSRREASVQSASEQSGGKKSGKGKKKKGHYGELAGLIAPELAKVNGVLIKGHREEQEGSAESGTAGIDQSNGTIQGAVDHSTHKENGSRQGTRHNGAYSPSPRPSYQGAWGGSSRDRSHAQASPPNRQRRGSGNHSLGGGANSSGSRKGKENRGQSSKQRKSKEEDKNKSSSSQMVEDIVPYFREMNARLEEQQRQQRERRSMNGAASSQGEVPDESVTRDTRGTPSHTPSANGHK